MIGGSPIQQPAYMPGYAQPYPPAAATPYSTVAIGAAQRQLPRARVRMQMDDAAPAAHPEVAPLRSPSPQQLGFAAKKKSVEVNWDDVGQRLRRLKIASFQLQKLPNGQGFRFICALPGGPGRQVQADAVTEAEAIDQALAQAEVMQ